MKLRLAILPVLGLALLVASSVPAATKRPAEAAGKVAPAPAPAVTGRLPEVTAKTVELGRGPTVVILHDLAGSPVTWMPLARALATDHRVVLVELPGTGGTPLPDPFSLEAVAAALDRVLARQSADSTILLANGMGGLVALLEIQAHPERTRGLMVLDAAAKPPFKLDSTQTRMFVDFIERNYDGFLETTYGRMGSDSAQNAMILAQARTVAPATIKAYLRAAMDADGAKGLPAMKTPFLFVATGRILGSDDWPTTARAIGYDDPAQVPVRLMPGVGYLVMRDQPDSLAAVVREFEAKGGRKP